ncbi:MAG: enoyl-CoA hydratase [Proteobacteria bacterium]|nr:enoyl-CoA hydratase [Pseudomonadota bacterium]
MNAPVDAGVLPYVERSDAGPVATLTLNRGTRYNALSSAMIEALDAAFTAVAADRAIRVVVLAAHGPGFCAGHDLKEMAAHQDLGWQRALFDRCSALMLRITRLPQPVIARVHGIATAAGCQLVATCDLVVAADTATFALPGVNVGVFCSTPAVAVGRVVARKRVMEMLLTGEAIDAPTALAWGLVNRVVPAARLDTTILELATAIAAKSANVIAAGKRVFHEQIDRGVEAAYEHAGEAMACTLLTPEAAEGIAAFVAKRAPRWPGHGDGA